MRIVIRATLVLALTAACYAPAVAPVAPQRTPAQVMSTAGTVWLERAERDAEERPDLVIAAMKLEPGDVVADVGAGSGYFTRRLSSAVGATGRVYANDIQQEMLDILRKNIESEKLTNVVPILGSASDPRLPKGGIDWVLLVDVYHEFQQPEAMLARIKESLKPGGRVALVEYREDAGRIRAEHRMTREQVVSEWTPAGFELLEVVETLPSQRLYIFEASQPTKN
ncbi:MAG: class I SAM-dependent methyltransferase [Thermoanaerobaculia bacterium]|nr:class I SAM-dependent methyltransferase [Thermoanaerobaculia bacterium]